MIIKRVGPMSIGKVAGTLYAAAGVLIGVVFALIGMAGGMASDNPMGRGFGAMFGIGAIVIFPILYGVMGFIFTMIAAALYNIVAGMVGGIEVDVE